MSNLFLVCPECHLEIPLRNRYGEDSCFLTALGAVFDFSESEYVEEIRQFVTSDGVDSISIVNSPSCRFIQKALEEKCEFQSRSASVLLDLVASRKSEFLLENDPAVALARANITRQAWDLYGVAFLEKKLQLERLN